MARTYGIREGDAGASDHAARQRPQLTAQLTPSIRMDTLFVPVSLRRRRARQSADQSGARPCFAHARIQSLRRSHRERKPVLEKPTFMQGLFSFRGRGLDNPMPFRAARLTTVPFDKRAQTIYFRAGNASAEMIYLVLTRRRQAHALLPGGRKERHPCAAGGGRRPSARKQQWKLLVARSRGRLNRSVLLDIGFMEIVLMTQKTEAGRHRQRHGGRAHRGRDPRARRRRSVRHHHVRRRAVRQLQPHSALERPERFATKKTKFSSIRSPGIEENNIRLHAGMRAAGLLRRAKLRLWRRRQRGAYDKLIIATGSRAFIPPMEGPSMPDGSFKPGVFVFRTLDDCREIAEYAQGQGTAPL